MLYRITRIFMTITLRLFYRRLYATGIETVPEKGPVILVANHPSSLMDAALLGILLKRPIHYFTRGDVFANRFISAILTALNMIPVFDHAYKDSLHDNVDSFRKAGEILQDGGLILFFPEGSSHVDRKLRPLKKGAFRLGFQVAEQLQDRYPFYIIPVGINYANPVSSQTDILVHIGTPLNIYDYVQKFYHHSKAGILQLKKDTEKMLLENALHIENDERQFLGEMILRINRNDYTYYTTHWVQATRKRFEEEKMICNAINKLQEAEATTLHSLASDYSNKLTTHRLTDAMISENNQQSRSAKRKLAAGFPLFLISYLLNALPVLIAKRIAERKVRRVDFYSWIFLTSAALMYCCWIVILFSGFLVVGIRYALVITVITLALGPFTVFYLNLWKRYRQQQRYENIKKNNPELVATLQSQRMYMAGKIRKLLSGDSLS
jgi:1-acyl-sn-glycerol-3-phosphate acyltransferase